MAAKNSKSPKEHGVDGTQASFEKHKSGKSVKQKPRPGKGKKKAASARGTGGAETKKKQTRLEKYQKNLALYRDMDYLEGEAETHLLMTREYLRSGNLPRAEFHATKSIEIYEKLESMEELAEAFELMGDVKEALDQESAVDDFRSARKIFEELEEKPRIRRLLVKSANVYLKHGNHKEALHRFSQAQGMEHTQDLVLSMGLCNEKLGELDKALDIHCWRPVKRSDRQLLQGYQYPAA